MHKRTFINSYPSYFLNLIKKEEKKIKIKRKSSSRFRKEQNRTCFDFLSKTQYANTNIKCIIIKI